MEVDHYTPKAGAFRSLVPPLAESLLKVLDSMGFETMTPVQASSIPLFLKNADVAVEVSFSFLEPS